MFKLFVTSKRNIKTSRYEGKYQLGESKVQFIEAIALNYNVEPESNTRAHPCLSSTCLLYTGYYTLDRVKVSGLVLRDFRPRRFAMVPLHQAWIVKGLRSR